MELRFRDRVRESAKERKTRAGTTEIPQVTPLIHPKANGADSCVHSAAREMSRSLLSLSLAFPLFKQSCGFSLPKACLPLLKIFLLDQVPQASFLVTMEF